MYVYVIGPAEGPYKIGITGDVLRRLQLLQTGSARRLACHYTREVQDGEARTIEVAAHRVLSVRRLTGEWFDCTIAEAISAVECGTVELEARTPMELPNSTYGLPPVHPGALLREDIFPAVGKGMTELKTLLGISRQQLYDIVNEKKPITANTALRFAKLLGNSAEFWLAMQNTYDLKTTAPAMAAELAGIPTLEAVSA